MKSEDTVNGLTAEEHGTGSPSTTVEGGHMEVQSGS